ncbi:hypothetical protein [Tissierella pigra]|uniref:hypothetical protein n=1 Tax=Tissierella pigra TaxID=2607614 RepID=UPI0018A6CF6E|nr:hypothetical protein [Tissierella pigra]
MNLKKDFYNLHIGLEICAWAKEVNYEYYLEGIKVLKGTVDKLMNKSYKGEL